MRSLINQQIVHCPNCGSKAERRYFTSDQSIHCNCPENQVIQTECAVCDYLMVMCSLDGSVIEAQAPGRWIPIHSSQENYTSRVNARDNKALSLIN